MRRFIASVFLCSGLLPVFITPQLSHAETTVRQTYESQCMRELRITRSDQPIASELFLLRRCINVKLAADQQALDAERIAQRADQKFWRNYDFGQAILQESRRSLKDRIQEQGDARSSFYMTVSVQERDQAMQEQRRKARTAIRAYEQTEIRLKREKKQNMQKALERCRTYSGELRYACLRGEI